MANLITPHTQPTTAWKVFGAKNLSALRTGGGSIYLFPPPLVYTGNDKATRMAEIASWLWKDTDCREFHEDVRPWCTATSEGFKLTLKEQEVEFDPNCGPKIVKKTGIYEEAKLVFSAFDTILSPAHYIDLMGENRLVEFYDKPQDSDGAEAGTERLVVGSTSLQRKVYAAIVSTSHPEFAGRRTVVWIYGEISTNIDAEFSKTNPLKMEVTFNLYPFPKLTQPNGADAYMMMEFPVEAPTVTP